MNGYILSALISLGVLVIVWLIGIVRSFIKGARHDHFDFETECKIISFLTVVCLVISLILTGVGLIKMWI
jgi:heme/copper-type cytochrome/quinol oxidase subunit 2